MPKTLPPIAFKTNFRQGQTKEMNTCNEGIIKVQNIGQ